MNKNSKNTGIPASGEQPHRRNGQGEALQMNDNSAGGKNLLLDSPRMRQTLTPTRVKAGLSDE
jgi:hypothetical protein